MVYAVVAGLLLFVILLIAFNVRSNGWRNRRNRERRKKNDRRIANGRRKNNDLERNDENLDRRHKGDRRIGTQTRRHKKRRAEDRLGRN